MIKAYRLYTGQDGHSHIISGRIINHELINAESVHFEESPPGSSLDWHTAPTTQYVITLAGILEFVTHAGETVTISPGEILIALDTTGSGHRWQLINDDPWKRVYVTFKESANVNFMPDSQS